MITAPKVSVIMPSLNVVSYIRECIESVINQTLRDIEIICVDAGSTDGTLEILREYATKDSRIQLIISDKKSYGYQMNLGLDAAHGEYLGIVETDDFVPPEMFEQLYELAEQNAVDFIKADFYRFVHNDDGEIIKTYNQLDSSERYYNRIMVPRNEVESFRMIMNTWSGIYNREFINTHHIRHNETLGASYQDNGFWFQTFAWAERAYFVNKPYYMNRRDNPNSSVHNKSKVYCMNEEYQYILNFLNKNPDLKEQLMPIYCFKKYQNYMFTYGRIADKFKLGYIIRFSEEFEDDYNNGFLEEKLFGRQYRKIMLIINNPLEFYLQTTQADVSFKQDAVKLQRLKQETEFFKKKCFDLENSISYRIGRFVTFFPRKIRGGVRCMKEHGLNYTFRRLLQKLRLVKGE